MPILQYKNQRKQEKKQDIMRKNKNMKINEQKENKK